MANLQPLNAATTSRSRRTCIARSSTSRPRKTRPLHRRFRARRSSYPHPQFGQQRGRASQLCRARAVVARDSRRNFGLGPLEPLLKDPTISDILVNRFDRVYVERSGKLEITGLSFKDNQHLMQIIDRIVSRIGRRVDESSPMVDARCKTVPASTPSSRRSPSTAPALHPSLGRDPLTRAT